MIGIVDYGVGNLHNLERGVRAAGCDAVFVDEPQALLGCDALLLPGVGAFGESMRRLRAAHLDHALQRYAASGRPLLGICLGMQLLLSRSQELGTHEGLGLIPGDVVAMVPSEGLAVPHVGWGPLIAARPWRRTLLDGVTERQEFYFTHSFVCRPIDERAVLARASYGSRQFTAVLANTNVMGCQFHPEMSAEAGIHMLGTFLTGCR